VTSSPAVVGGTVYVGSQDNNVYAIDAETGQKKWDIDTESQIISSPAVVRETIYIGSTDGNLYALW
jgi:outer membrane protein assembly factor BamB